MNRQIIAAAAAGAFHATAAGAQYASDKPVTAADDVYGLTCDWSQSAVQPRLMRGFRLQIAGNARIDGYISISRGA